MSEENTDTEKNNEVNAEEFYDPSYKPGSVIPRPIVDEMKSSYLDYSMSVIVSRALPEVKDGLKPSQRRILVSMNDLGLTPGANYRKSAKIAGDTSGNYHPHGESVVYPTMVKLAQDFSTRYPLVDGQGNFGCFTKDTKVQLTDGRKLSFEGLIKEHEEGKKNYTYTIDKDQIKIAEIKHPRLTKVNQEIMKVTLDNEEEIRCTLDHRFMLKNGKYKQAQNLKQGESLMPLYTKLSTKENCPKIKLLGYTLVLNPIKNNWVFAHYLADLFNIENNTYKKSKGRVRHHIDFDKENKGGITFDSFDNIVKESKTYNHKVSKIEILDTREDVYDLTIDNTHNFALASGVFVHNSIDGDRAAAMRYTEAKMAKYTMEILRELDKGTVTYVQNYDGTRLEPEVLPTLFPNLICNGSDGIAVGMATKIPPHNLNEVMEALIHMIELGNKWEGKYIYNELRKGREKQEEIPKTLESHPLSYISNYASKKEEVEDIKERINNNESLYPEFESHITPEDLIKHIPGPDFPTGGTIYDQKEIMNMYATGRGRVLCRAKADIEETKGGKYQIVVTEIPYQVNKAHLLEKIAHLVKEKRLTGISDIRDESNRDGMRIIISIKKDAQPKTVLNNLYKHTEMQKAFNSNVIALVEQEPATLNLKRMLELFLSFRITVTIRRYEYDLAQAKYRAHILEGLLKALDILDEIISTIRNSKTQEEAKTNLIENYEFTSVQAQAILDMQLRKLAALERQKISDEYDQIKKDIQDYLAILNSQNEILNVIKKEFQYLKDKYGDERKTKVIKGKIDEISEEDLVPSEDTFITISYKGYVKRLNPETYRTQKRGGKGVAGAVTKEDDFVKHALMCNTHDDLMLFTNTGRVLITKAYEIPEYSRTAKGLPIINLVSLNQDEIITSVLTRKSEGKIVGIDEQEESREKQPQYLFMATKDGTVKKTKIEEFSKIRASGLIAIKLDKNDELNWVKPTTGEDDIIVVTSMGRSIRFNEQDVRKTGRNSRGVRGIKFKFEQDEVISMGTIKNDKNKLFILSEEGFGKMTLLSNYPTQKRGGSGVFTFKVKEKTGKVVGATTMDDPNKEIVVVSKKGIVIRSNVEDIPTLGRQTSGVRVMKLNGKDGVATFALV